MKTERRRPVEPPKRRLIIVPETQPYGVEHAETATQTDPERDTPTRRERAVQVDNAGRYSHVYGRKNSTRPPRA